MQAQPTGQAQQAHAPGSRAEHSPQHQATGAHRQARRQGTQQGQAHAHTAATLAAHTAQGSQGTKASSTPASDERCDSMHHLHVV